MWAGHGTGPADDYYERALALYRKTELWAIE